MNWEAIGAISETVGAIAVVVTLIYVAVQIRQSNDLLRSESRRATVENDKETLVWEAEHVEIFEKVVQNEELSFREKYLLSIYWTMHLRNREFEYFQFQHGAMDQGTWETYRELILVQHSTVLGRQWWNDVGKLMPLNPEFIEMADELLRDAPIDDELWQVVGVWGSGTGTSQKS